MSTHSGVLYRSGSKVLLMKRRADDNHGGEWAFPAGRKEAGETQEQAAIREFAEETGKVIDSPLKQIFADEIITIYETSGADFEPRLNEEHTESMWAETSSLPSPLHPGVMQLVATYAQDGAQERDQNGYITIKRNPISRAGVFPYLGKSLPDAEPDRVYNVLRPVEELSSPETLESFKLLPLINEHEMLGDPYPTAAEEKGVHGTTGEEIVFEGRDILAPLRIFSRTLKWLLESGKRGLSAGYTCVYEKSSGVFEGMPYDYIQRRIRGNHIALVEEGRCGTVVLDHHLVFDHFDLALDKQETIMADEVTEKTEGEKEYTLTEVTTILKKVLPEITAISEAIAKMNAPAAEKSDAAAVVDEDMTEKPGDQDACDAEEEEKTEKKEDAMDALEIKTRLEAVEKRGVKSLLADVAARDRLAKEVSAVVGTFDHSEMTADEVAAYACEKLNIKADAAHRRAALDGYLAGRASKTEAAFALDTKIKSDGLLAKRLNKTA